MRCKTMTSIGSTSQTCVIILSVIIATSLAANPVVDYFDQPANVEEDPQTERQVAEITATDSDGDTIASCSVKNVAPNGPFNAQKKAGDTNYWVYYDATSALDYDTVNFYEIRVFCTDSSGADSQDVDLFVHVLPNEAPVITNYPTDTVTLDASTFDYTTDTAYQVTATDGEGDTLTYSLTNQDPSTGLFTINSATGAITTTQDLRLVTEPSYVLTVSVSDGKNTVSDFGVVVTIDNMNTAPEIRNLPTTVSVSEDAGLGTTLITLTIEDPTQYPGPIVPTCTTSPSAESYKFQYNSGDSSITLTGDNLLDYETQDTYTITCTVSDGFYSSGGGDVLTISVENVNEGPSFNNNDYYCTMTESDQRDNYCTLSLTVTDPEGDDLDTIKFQTATDSEKFYYDKDTNRVYFNVDYDVDDSNMPSSLDLVLETADTSGATATATVHITVNDANDNACQFDKEVSYTKIDQTTSLGLLDTFTLADSDLTSPNNEVSVQIVSSDPTDSGNYITVTQDGEVYYIGTVPTANTGSSYTMLVTCTDGGSPAQTSYATVIVSYTYVTTTTTPTTTTTTAAPTTTAEPEPDIWDYDWFVAVFSLLMILILATLIATIAFLIYKCCCQGPSGATGKEKRKGSPRESEETSGRRSRSYLGDFDDDDYFATSPRPNQNGHAWQYGPALSPRQIPAIGYK